MTDPRLAKSKVSNPHMPFKIDKYVLRLDISINNVSRVQTFYDKEDLNKVESGRLFGHTSKLFNVSEELASWAVWL